GRRRGQRHPRPVRGRGQLPVRAGQDARAGGRRRAPDVRRVRGRDHRPLGRRAPRARRPHRAVVRRGRGRRPAAEVRLDRRRAVQRARHTGRQLRPGRRAARAPRPGACARAADRGRRARAARMAHGGLTREDAPVSARLASRPAWIRVLVVYAASRLVTTALALLSAALAPADGRHGPDPSLMDYVVGWDAAWYREIALNGYPESVPVDDAGVVQQNAWAFMPVFPTIARILA